MSRYYFDMREANAIAPDEEGLELPSIEAAQVEAAQALADMARDTVPSLCSNSAGRQISIEVRDDDGPVLRAKLVIDIVRQRN